MYNITIKNTLIDTWNFPGKQLTVSEHYFIIETTVTSVTVTLGFAVLMDVCM